MEQELFDLHVIETIEEAIIALKDRQVLISESKLGKCYFKQSNKKVLVVDVNAKYSLSYEEFQELYKTTTFIVYEHKEDTEFDFSRDEEYYSWKHK